MARPPYELTAHAAVVIADREIELAWVERTFLNPERTEADRGTRCDASPSGMTGSCG